MKRHRWKKAIEKRNLSPANNRKRVGVILFSVTIAMFLIFIVRFSYIIVFGKVAGVSLTEQTKKLYQGSSVVKAKRGSILDRNGAPIAIDATSYSLHVVLSEDFFDYTEDMQKRKLYLEAENDQATADILAKYTNIKAADFLKAVSNGRKKKRFQVEFGNAGKDISLETKNKIEKELNKASIRGVDFDEHSARIYPNGVYASHLVGYAQLADKNDESKGLEGIMGIERAYEKELSGKDGKIRYRMDANGNPMPSTIVEEKKAEEGKDLYLTLDSNLQLYLEELMTAAAANYQPEELTSMLVDAKTGDIIAASQRPTFNPETKEGLGGENAMWQNLLVETAFEPGSTIKILTVAAAIETGVFNGDATFQSGTIEIADAHVSDWKNMGTLTYRQAIPCSSNVGMVHLQEAMGERWQDYIKKFGFGESTHSKLWAEASGGMWDQSNQVSQAMSAFGQAINVTDFQMVQAFSAIANGGKMLKPQYIKKIYNPETDKTEEVKPTVVSEPIQASTATQVLDMMKDTVDQPYGTGYGIYNLPDYQVAAKTGTAEIPGENGYSHVNSNDYIFSVVQMVPADNPKYIMYTTMKRPHASSTESRPAKMIADITNPLLTRALEMDAAETSDESAKENESKFTVPNLVDQNAADAAAMAQDAQLEVITLGEGGTIIKQSAKVGETLLPQQKLLLLTDGQASMPNIKNWSKSDVLKLSDLIGMKTEIEGQGYVQEQSIPEGTAIDKNSTLTVKLGDQPS